MKNDLEQKKDAACLAQADTKHMPSLLQYGATGSYVQSFLTTPSSSLHDVLSFSRSRARCGSACSAEEVVPKLHPLLCRLLTCKSLASDPLPICFSRSDMLPFEWLAQ